MFLPSDITLRPGDSGDFVAELQRRLAKRDMLAEGHVTSLYDEMTTQAVRNFQQLSGIKTDGIAGPETLRRLNGLVSGGDDDRPTEEEEEEKELVEERAEDLVAMNRNFTELQTNEAIFDPDHNSLDQLEQDKAEALDKEVNQLSDLTQQQEQVIAQREAMREPTEHNKPIDLSGKEVEQIHSQHEHARAEKPNFEEMAAQQEQSSKEAMRENIKADLNLNQKPAPETKPLDVEQVRDTSLPDQQAYAAPATTAKPSTLTPGMQRTEASLSPPDKQTSREEGKKLDSKGVKEGQKMSEKELGELVPSQTPAKGQQQQVEIG